MPVRNIGAEHTSDSARHNQPAYHIRRNNRDNVGESDSGAIAGAAERIKVTQTVRLWFNDFNLIVSFRVQCIPFRCDAVSVELPSPFVVVLIQFVNFQD